MRLFWTVLKIALGLAIAIPVGLIVLATTLGILGALFGLAVLVLKLAFVGLIAYGAFRVARGLFGSTPAPKPQQPVVHELPSRDPYYDAAMRELDSELGRYDRR